MKKFMLAIIILGMVSTLVACKKNTADTAENNAITGVETSDTADTEENIGNTAVETSDTADTAENIGSTADETSESAEEASFKPMETVESLQLELKEGQVGEISPD